MASSPHEPQIQDFASPTSPTSPLGADHAAPDPAPAHLNVDTSLDGNRTRGRSATSTTATAARPHSDEPRSPDDRASIDSTLRRRVTRSHTVRHYASPTRPYQHQEPGAEPGVDTKNDTATAKYQHLHARCQVTVVDFSDERVMTYELDNDTLEEFLAHPKDAWVACRWINVNGLSWDVIRTLGNHKNLHSLAIEDLMSTNGRTKVDWYSDQAFCECSLPRLPAQLCIHNEPLLTTPSIVNALQASPTTRRPRLRQQRLRL